MAYSLELLSKPLHRPHLWYLIFLAPFLLTYIPESLWKYNGLMRFVLFLLKAQLPLWILKQFLRMYLGETWV